jgi:hypothetical protein
MDSWRELAESLLNPDRRIFKDKSGGIHNDGAIFPVTGDVIRNASDDGLGRQLRNILDSSNPEWSTPLRPLLFPDQSDADAPLLVMQAILTSRGTWRQAPHTLHEYHGPDYNDRLVKFVTNLITSKHKWCRLNVIRELALGAFTLATLQTLQYNLVKDGTTHFPVLCYAGLPPGNLGNPIVKACSDSWNSAVTTSYVKQTAELQSILDDKTYRVTRLELFKKQNPKFQLADAAKLLSSHVDANTLLDKLEYTQREFSRRLKSLGANVGVAGPDGGSTNPRFYLDTPLLGVIVRGIVGDGAIELDEFVTEVYRTLGLVLGAGCDGLIMNEFSHRQLLTDRDLYTLLTTNTELLRERLIRTGLARTYSDSHTEVTLYA